MIVSFNLCFCSCGSDSKVSACNVGDLGQEDPLEKEMATHSSTLAWKIPWTEEPGRLQSMGSQSRTRLSNFTFFHFSALVLPKNQKSYLKA